LWRALFWRVGRRLAFSYFLVGVLPAGLLALLALLASYLLGGFLLGHLYRDGVAELGDEVESAAIARLLADEPADSIPTLGGRLRAAEYRRGRRVTDDESAPGEWPEWVAAAQEARRRGDAEALARPFWALADGRLTMAAVAGRPGDGVLVWFEGDLANALRERTRSWVDLYRHDDPRKLPMTRLQLGGRSLSIRGFWLSQDATELAEYYRLNPPEEAASPGWLERPWILWSESTGRAEALADGGAAAEFVTVSLASGPRGLFRSLLSVSDQADSTAWLALVGVAILLFEIWLAAAAMAVFMIVGLSRAVNRLSQATAAIAEGDFSFRIPVKRKDQVGELQRSFNAMAEHLSELVDTAAQKEALDKELDLARRVQRDLLPDLIESASGAEIATTFEPSAAIGGDYFDILRRPGGKLAIVVADVAGHGLAAGLRMAMVKSAIVLLAEEEIDADGIVTRLRRLLRGRPGERGFITLSFTELTLATGELEITNAGHPPCYRVRRDGEVDEIALPGLPLGTLPGAPGAGRLRLEPGDAMVWLSDGIPECTSSRDEPFGYDGVARALAGPFDSAEALRDRLLAGLQAHCGDAPVQDDRTLVVLRYVPERLGSPSRA
ncbi:MAG: SpoIIE family protein phosphatase, partial [Thermoanaerobaculia bacterium]|nr:SpoIIE family protein phosphatase [Thermoanaerobaculia bacterium]